MQCLELFTRAELAKLLGFSTRSLDRLRADPEQEFPMPIGAPYKQPRWLKTAIEDWLKRRINGE